MENDDIRNYYPEHPIAFRSLSLEEGDVWVIDLIGWNYKITADTGEIIERVYEK